MKKSTSLLLALMTMLLMSSCVSTKKIVYFQDSDQVFKQGQQMLQQYEMRLKPADQVYIKVTCSEPELLSIFAQDVVMGTAGGGTSMSSSYLNSSGNMSNAYGYTVSNDGSVTLPAVGRVNVSGLTMDEAAKRIEESIIEANLIKDPEVTVQKISLYREENGVRKKYSIDLTDSQVFQNPAYYVQQNDMIYVEPNKSQSVKSSAFYTFLGAGASIVSVISSIVSIVILVTR